MEYENTQKRILEVFTQWKAPDNFKIEMFVIRVGDWGGYMLLDCDDPLAVPTGSPLALRAEVRRIAGRQVFAESSLALGEDVLAEGAAVFLRVSLRHFLRTPEGRAARDAWRARLAGDA